jgi:hypothetical protein
MRKIVVGAQVSMDGVMQAPGGPWEDPTKGFKFGASAGGIAKLFKEIKKYVVSCSGHVETSWRGSVLLRDIKIGDTALDSPGDAERARRERMKREG